LLLYFSLPNLDKKKTNETHGKIVNFTTSPKLHERLLARLQRR
jgi:hypothetical protein